MSQQRSPKALIHSSAMKLMSISVLMNATVIVAEPVSSLDVNVEETMIFMGKCPNGEPYRLKAYQKLIEGSLKSFYDYQGPAGQGTIQTQTPPKTIAVRVCRQLAEIVGDS